MSKLDELKESLKALKQCWNLSEDKLQCFNLIGDTFAEISKRIEVMEKLLTTPSIKKTKKVKTSQLAERAIELASELFDIEIISINLCVRFDDESNFMVWCDQAHFNKGGNYVFSSPIEDELKAAMGFGETINQALVDLIHRYEAKRPK